MVLEERKDIGIVSGKDPINYIPPHSGSAVFLEIAEHLEVVEDVANRQHGLNEWSQRVVNYYDCRSKRLKEILFDLTHEGLILVNQIFQDTYTNRFTEKVFRQVRHSATVQGLAWRRSSQRTKVE